MLISNLQNSVRNKATTFNIKTEKEEDEFQILTENVHNPIIKTEKENDEFQILTENDPKDVKIKHKNKLKSNVKIAPSWTSEHHRLCAFRNFEIPALCTIFVS